MVGWFRRHRGFDKEGIFILDLSLLPVPENPNYKRTGRLPLDEDGNLIDLKDLSQEERTKVKYRPCYGFTSLLHITRKVDYFLYAGMHLGPGTDLALKQGERIVDNFVANFGKGIIQLLIVDRGFIDGEMIARFKKDYRIDTLVPLKSNMEILTDALGLASLPEVEWKVYSQTKDKDGSLIETEEITSIKDMSSWESCDLPLYVVAAFFSAFPRA